MMGVSENAGNLFKCRVSFWRPFKTDRRKGSEPPKTHIKSVRFYTNLAVAGARKGGCLVFLLGENPKEEDRHFRVSTILIHTQVLQA